MIYVYVYSYVIVLAACCLHKESSLQKWKTGIKEQGFTSWNATKANQKDVVSS